MILLSRQKSVQCRIFNYFAADEKTKTMINLNRYFILILCTVFSLLNTIPASSQTYNYIPDSTFDGNGLKSFIYFNNIDRAYGCALQADDKLVMTGLSKNPVTGYFELCVTRLNVDGSFDSTFNNDGNCFINMGDQMSIGGMTPKVKIAPDGKIVVVNSGSAPSTGNEDMMICRLDTNGFLDNSFNNSGVLFVDMTGSGTQPDKANAVDIDANGNIWAAGATRVGSTPVDNDFAVVKITPSGQLDPSFDNDGKKFFNPSGIADFALGIKVQNDGKIVVAGDAGANMAVIRFDSTGTPDNTFNTTGTSNIAFQLSSDMGAMDIDDQGRIIVAGQLVTSSSSVAVARLLPSGTLDAAFGFNGKYTFNIGAASYITDIHIQADQKILLGGYSEDSTGTTDYMATRIESGGVIDLTFNGNGFVRQPVISGAVNEEGNGMAVMDDGRIMMTGTTVFSSAINEDIGIIRLMPVLATGLSEVVSKSSLSTFPNPFGDRLNITSASYSGEVRLTDLSGRECSHFSIVPGYNTIDTRELPSGIYILHTSNGEAFRLIRK